MEHVLPNWEQLPTQVLVQIFSNLSEKDRASASLVSKQWATTFRFPQLWRNMEFNFNESDTQEKRAIKFMDSLESDWRSKLSRDMIARTVSRLMDKQRKLKSFSMNCSDIDLNEGLLILERLSASNALSLQRLDIENFFTSRYNLQNEKRYVDTMLRFVNLNFVALSYGCLEEDMLIKLVENCKNKLQDLRINCTRGEPCMHRISSTAWNKIRKMSPQLKVNVDIHKPPDFGVLRYIIPPGIPLHGFHYCPGNADVEVSDINSWELNNLLLHLSTYFHDTLTKLELFFENAFDFEDSLLRDLMLATGPRLKKFNFCGMLLAETVMEILDWQTEGKINLKECILMVTEASGDGNKLFEGAMNVYGNLFASTEVHFEIMIA